MTFKISYIFLLLTILWSGCSIKEDTLFTKMSSSDTNISFENKLKESTYFNILEYLYYYNGGGVAVGDINNDGLSDIYFVSNLNENKLYLNKGDFVFEDITELAGVAGEGYWSTGVSMADVNGDGFLDIYVCEVSNYKITKGRNQLFINNGNMTFEEKAIEYGLDFQGFSTQSTFFDYDKDGDLDMFLLNHAVHTRRSYGDTTLRYEKALMSGDRLFRNDDNGGTPYFTDVTDSSGILRSLIGYGLGVSVSDINNDGWPDLYVSNDFHEDDYLYINNRNGTFTESLKKFISHTSRFSMGNDIADINNDGLMDIIELDMLPSKEKILKKSAGEETNDVSNIKKSLGYHHQLARNTLQLNLGGGLFSDVAPLVGLFATDWSWSPLIADFDNNGHNDFFISNGIYRRPNDLDYINFVSNGGQKIYRQTTRDSASQYLISLMPSEKISNYAFKNDGDLKFEDVSSSWGLNEEGFSTSSAYADFDNDGDLDLVINNLESKASIYRNNSDSKKQNNFLSLSFEGTAQNRKGIGAKVTVKTANSWQYKNLYPTKGFMASVDYKLIFGLGKEKLVDSVVITWESGKKELLTNISVNQNLIVKEDNAKFYEEIESNQAYSLLKEDADFNLDYSHQENDFRDFDTEFLIPHKISTQGPKIAKADINGDGLEDFYIGGAEGQSGKLFLQNETEQFIELPNKAFIVDSLFEDVDAEFSDVDGDSDLDLIVVSGGNHYKQGNELLNDRLYLNQGEGRFTKALNFPSLGLNGASVSASDYDSDGDIDLFIGSRSVPGNYGKLPESVLLVNNGNGDFEKSTSFNGEIGLVTASSWVDYDEDGDEDLIVVGEWMPITVFNNDNGDLVNTSKNNGLVNSNGWWNSLEIADLDGDGDEDFIAGNLGFNSKLQATKDKPVKLFVKDFDENGSVDPILCHFKEGYLTPFPTVMNLTRQITSLRKRFRTFSEYSTVKTIEDIFSPEELKDVSILEAYTFASSWVENKDGEFIVHALPQEVQFSPVFSTKVVDYNGDGFKDIILGGNLFGASINYGRYDASYGWVLQGGENNQFKTLSLPSSGMAINGEIRDIELFSKENSSPFILISINDNKVNKLNFNSEEKLNLGL